MLDGIQTAGKKGVNGLGQKPLVTNDGLRDRSGCFEMENWDISISLKTMGDNLLQGRGRLDDRMIIKHSGRDRRMENVYLEAAPKSLKMAQR